MLSHEQVRRAVSVDFTVPVEHRDELRLSDSEWVVPLAVLAKRKLVHFDLFGEDGYALPLLRSDEARLIARELLYLMLDIDVEDAELDFDASDLIERVLAAGPNDTEAVTARVDAVGRPARRSSPRWRGLLTSKFLLCAVLDDVTQAARGQVRVRRAARAAGSPVALLRHAGLHGGGELPRGAGRAGGDARPQRGHRRQPHGRAAARRARATPTARRLHYVAGAGAEIEPGPERELRHRARRVPGAGDARGVGDRARARAGVGCSPTCAGSRSSRRPGDRGAAVVSAVFCEPGAARGRASAGPARARALPDAAWRAATLAAVAAGGTLAFRGSEVLLNWTWGLGAVVALVAAGILSIEVARAPATAKRP